MERIEGVCSYYVMRKKRNCRMTVKPGQMYCGEHQPIDNTQKSDDDKCKKRVPCPLDPKHTCFADKLDKHLKVCNAKQTDLPSYIVKDCNADNSGGEYKRQPLSEIADTELSRIIAIIEKIYKAIIDGNISTFEAEPHPSVVDELNNKLRTDSSKKHLIQISALLNLIEHKRMLIDSTCYIELGAGKGLVSFYLASSTKSVPNSSVLLIDRASHRHKQDNKVKEDHHVQRLRADISDVVLSEIPLIQQSESVVGVSKHLCGVATDLALRCLTNPKIVGKINGIIMATCCHHRCIWSSYVGKEFLSDYDVKQTEFDVICGLVSWATCGTGLSREKRDESGLNTSKESKKARIGSDDHGRLGLSQKEREEIGFKAKSVLDWGRMLYLKSNKFKSELYFYVDKSVSPENVCIVADGSGK